MYTIIITSIQETAICSASVLDDRRKLYGSPSLSGLATDDKRDEEQKKCVLIEIQGMVIFYMRDDAEIAYVEEKE